MYIILFISNRLSQRSD